MGQENKQHGIKYIPSYNESINCSDYVRTLQTYEGFSVRLRWRSLKQFELKLSLTVKNMKIDDDLWKQIFAYECSICQQRAICWCGKHNIWMSFQVVLTNHVWAGFDYTQTVCVESKRGRMHRQICNPGAHRITSDNDLAFNELFRNVSAFICKYFVCRD